MWPWKRKKKPSPEVEAVFRKMSAAAFPGGEQQIALEAAEVESLLDGSVSRDYAREMLVHAKGRALLAIRSAKDSEEAVQRCIDSVWKRSQGKLDRSMAEKVAVFAVQRLVDQHAMDRSTGGSVSWTEMTKEEALQVSRLTAYRIARHQGRTDADSQQVYDLDPETYILTAMAHYLTGSTDEQRTKIETTQDAVELSLKVTSMLALAYHAEKHGAASLPNPKEIDRLAKEELERTLGLIRNKEAVERYSEYDPAEAKAARQMHVPFNIVLTLGKIGLLQDPPGPTNARRRMLRRLREGIS